jgi:hypothetical protein
VLKIGDMVKYKRTDALRVAYIYQIKMRAGQPLYMIRYIDDGFQWGYKEADLEKL